MRFFVRIYRRFDIDLYTLAANGYSVNDLIRDAVTSYANNTPYHVYMDRILPTAPVKNKAVIRYNITIPSSDKNTIDLLKNILPGLRNSFCKACARNALLKQNLSVYFTKKELLLHERSNMEEYIDYNVKNLRSIGIYSDPNRDKKILEKLLRGTTSEPLQEREHTAILTSSVPVPDNDAETHAKPEPAWMKAAVSDASPAWIGGEPKQTIPHVEPNVIETDSIQTTELHPTSPSKMPIDDAAASEPSDSDNDIMAMFENL